MTYRFKQFQAGRFAAFLSVQERGDTHKKRFIEDGITPMLQGTLNIYVSGAFDFGPEGGEAVRLVAGDTSLDLPFPVFPKGVVFVETVISETASRLCLSPSTPAPWTKRKLSMAESDEIDLSAGACAFLLSGEVAEQADENGFFVGPMLIRALRPSVLIVAE